MFTFILIYHILMLTNAKLRYIDTMDKHFTLKIYQNLFLLTLVKIIITDLRYIVNWKNIHI